MYPCTKQQLDHNWNIVLKHGSHIVKKGHESRLLQCGLITLETRRLRVDQIEVLKIVNGYEDVDRNMFFKRKEGSRTR